MIVYYMLVCSPQLREVAAHEVHEAVELGGLLLVVLGQFDGLIHNTYIYIYIYAL